MTVSELMAELSGLPPHHPVMINAGFRYNEPIAYVGSSAGNFQSGPCVVIMSETDPRNDPDHEVYL